MLLFSSSGKTIQVTRDKQTLREEKEDQLQVLSGTCEQLCQHSYETT